ncbi:MAG TPA: hypothetical protein VJN93_03530 [Candidatus Acidoferrum sp.]|nr:hypothetical protein [Candidatus Acidoferrum sp.]
MENRIASTSEGVRSATFQDARAALVLILVLTGSLALNVRLGWKVNKLEGLLAGSSLVSRLALGAAVPSIRATDLEGNQTIITYSGHPPTVLYVFVPPCGWCARNQANIRALVRTRGKVYRFVGLSLSDEHLKEYVAKSGIEFPVYSHLAPEAVSELGLGSTPQTLVVSSEGKLLGNWTGAYGDDLRPEIEKYFGVDLPGLTK